MDNLNLVVTAEEALMAPRSGVKQRADIPPEILQQLNAGILESATLAEGLAVNFVTLMTSVVPEISQGSLQRLQQEPSITKRMKLAGEILFESGGVAGVEQLQLHPSDTVRAWGAYVLAQDSDLSLPERLALIRPFADDAHFGVREWAWMATRPWLVQDLETGIPILSRWTGSDSAHLRRFAVEITRPRGVWCSHIQTLKDQPALGMPLLEPLKQDPSRYVQDSVANWLNDAGKSQPQFVRDLCNRWQHESQSKATAYICKRALRRL